MLAVFMSCLWAALMMLVLRSQDLSKCVGVVMLRDTTPGEEVAPEDLVDIKPPPAQAADAEPDPPEPFEWVPN